MKDTHAADDPLLATRAQVNPYLRALSLISHQLAWDLRPAAWSSRRRLKALRNTKTGKAVILCNGPSLNKVDFDHLAGRAFTFGLNKINLLFDRTPFRPDAIVAVNELVLEQNSAFFEETDIPLFLDSAACLDGLVSPAPRRYFLRSADIPKFARDCSMAVHQGATVTYVALQLAFHMGFREVALVGADHSFAAKGPANKAVRAGATDVDHFDPDYFARGVQWQLPDLFESEVSYMRARNMYEAAGRRIVNCTEGGKLEIFERQPLAQFLDP
jgi:hypothetical protein